MTPNWPPPAVNAGSRMTAARVMPGAISLSSPSHFPLMLYSYKAKTGDIAARPSQTIDEAAADRINHRHEYDRHCVGRLLQCCDARTAGRQDDIRRQRDQFRREFANAIGIARAPAVIDLHIPADGPARLLQPLMESREACLTFRIIGGEIHQHADAPHPLRLLRARRERPCRRRAAEQRDELAPFHSITSSARARSVGGISIPSALAVLRLITRSYLVGACTGKSAAFSPLRIRSM